MWLPFTQKWRRINLSSYPSCRLTSSATWHFLPLPLTHLNDKQSCPFSFLQGALLFVPFDLDQTVAHIFLPIFWPKLWSIFYFHLIWFYLTRLSTLLILCGNTCYLSLNCLFVWEGLEPSFVLRTQLWALHVLLAINFTLNLLNFRFRMSWFL